MEYTAAQWRPLIKQETARYADTPGGAPPWQVVEGLVNLESGGDPNNVTDAGNGDVAVGLGQITTRGYEYDLYRKRFPNGPIDLTDPQTNMRITVMGLDAREEQGIRAAEAGQPHALSNWFVAAAAYFGAATNEGVNNATDRLGTSGPNYVSRIQTYMRDVLRLTPTQIDAIGAGTNAGGNLGSGTQYDNPLPGPGDVRAGLGGLAETLTTGFMRAVPFAIGILMLAYGAYRVATT